MKKSLALALVLALLLALAAPAFAFAIERSAQSLTVDGRAVTCDKYNIEGSNYFKLRDLAALLSGTGSQFDVGWDADKQLVSITTNHAYTTPNGTELTVGEDKSSTAVLSAQTIMIDGQVRRDLTVYNIGGSNFFKLRELGDALGFAVDYDGVIFSDFAGGTPLVGEGDFAATIVYLDDLGMEDPVPGTDYDRFDFDAAAAAGVTGMWYGTYNDLSGESHGLTLEIDSWGELWLRDVTDADIPRVLAGSYYIADANDDMAPAGSVVFNLVSLAGYKMPSIGFCTMTVGSDGMLRVTDAFDSYDALTRAGDGVTVTLKPVPGVRSTVYAEP